MKKARSSKKVTLRTLSQYVGKSIGYLSDIENERKNPPSLDIVSKIEECLELKDNSLINLANAAKHNISKVKKLSDKMIVRPNLAEFVYKIDQAKLTDSQLEEILEKLNK